MAKQSPNENFKTVDPTQNNDSINESLQDDAASTLDIPAAPQSEIESSVASADDESQTMVEDGDSLSQFFDSQGKTLDPAKQPSVVDIEYSLTTDDADATYQTIGDTTPEKEKTSGSDKSDKLKLNSFGRYKVQRLLGHGAFGRVYAAHDTQLNRMVAVKVAKVQSRAGSIDGFLREARAAAHLRHPAIIPVYEYGEVNEQSMIVYELINGEALRTRIHRSSSIELKETIEVIRKIAEGLDYAHRQGIVHRDIKPENILIDENGDPHIADFGCARRFDDHEMNTTLDGSILGTPSYMSPEQASGRSNKVDGRTDVWSLGVMLYEMVSGIKPFQGNLMDLLDTIQNRDAIPLRRIRSDIPRDVETICSRCLQRDLNHRFASAGDVADELERIQRGIPIRSRKVNVFERTGMWAKRNPMVASLLTAIGAILVIATMVSSSFWILAEGEKKKRAEESLKTLTTADSNQLKGILENLGLSPQLMKREIVSQLDMDQNEKNQRRLLIGLAKLVPSLGKENFLEIQSLLPTAEPGEIIELSKALSKKEADAFADYLWAYLQSTDAKTEGGKLAALGMLANLQPESEKWETTGLARDAAGFLTSKNLVELKSWLPAVRPIKSNLQFENAMHDFFNGSDRTTAEAAAFALSDFHRAEVEHVIEDLLPTAKAFQLYHLIPPLSKTENENKEIVNLLVDRLNNSSNDHVEKSNLITALIQLKTVPDVWQRNLRTGSRIDSNIDNSTGTEVIEKLGPAGTNVEIILEFIDRLATNGGDADVIYKDALNRHEEEWNALAVLILSLGQYREIQIPPSIQTKLWDQKFAAMFKKHPNARVHSSIRWLYTIWGMEDKIADAEVEMASPKHDDRKNWHVDENGYTFVIFDAPSDFSLGKTWHEIQDHRFGICIHEVESRDVRKFEKDMRKMGQKFPDDDTAVVDVQFVWALGYCHWLTTKGQIDKDSFFKTSVLKSKNVDLFEFLFKPKKGVDGKKQKSAYSLSNRWFRIKSPCYRLPTKSEWLMACRAFTGTKRSMGNGKDNLASYAWYSRNSEALIQRVAQLKPNESGLFDLLGNASEWTLDSHIVNKNDVTEDRLHCGGDYRTRGDNLVSDISDRTNERKIQDYLGFRLARTYPAVKTVPAKKGR